MRNISVIYPSRLANMSGRPLRVEFVVEPRDRRGAVHGGALVRQRRMLLDSRLRVRPAEFARIFTHELFHFAWVRLSNRRRREWAQLLVAEVRAGARGELGWSAEWRKRALRRATSGQAWREYACESFCDTAAWLFSGVDRHSEFTLAKRFRERRRRWFQSLVTEAISI